MRWLITGYYGLGNFGDDIMLAVLTRLIERVDPSAHIRVFVAPGGSAKLLPKGLGGNSLVPASRGTVAARIQPIKEADVVLYGGGTCLHSKGFCDFWTALVAAAFGKPFYWVGVGANPVRDCGIEPYVKARLVLSICKGATFRDTESRAVAEDLAPGKDVWWRTGDLAFLLEDILGPISPGRAVETVGAESLLVSWRGDSGWDNAAIRHNVAEGIVFGLKHCPFPQITVLNLADRIDGEANRQFASLLRSRIKEQRLACNVVEVGEIGWMDKVELIRRAGALISVRLHGLLIGKLLNTPSIGIDYAPKVDRLAKLFDRSPVLRLEDVVSDPVHTANALCTEVTNSARWNDLPLEKHKAYKNLTFLEHIVENVIHG